MRLDAAMVARGLARSRPRAKALIARGAVCVDGITAARASKEVPATAEITLSEQDHPFVSRGALKLNALIEAVPEIPLANAVVIDVGASTGGFTELALSCGAAHVYAVDVGSDQFDSALGADARVTLMENTDARGLTPKQFAPEPTVMVSDVSFISLTKILPAVVRALESIFHICCLVKPQFEVGREHIGKNGIVTDEDQRLKALAKVAICLQDLGFEIIHDMVSPLAGGSGNIEYLIYARRP